MSTGLIGTHYCAQLYSSLFLVYYIEPLIVSNLGEERVELIDSSPTLKKFKAEIQSMTLETEYMEECCLLVSCLFYSAAAPLFFFKKMYLFLFHVNECFACIYVSTLLTYLVFEEVRRWCQILWKRSYWCL